MSAAASKHEISLRTQTVLTPTISPGVSRPVLLLTVAIAGAAGLLATSPEASAMAVSNAGAELSHLLRAMAGLKMLMAGGAVAGMLWRFGTGVTPGRLLAYLLACAAMATGPGLIWDMAHVGVGALLLHGGLLASLLLLWRDPAASSRLAAAVAARRAKVNSVSR